MNGFTQIQNELLEALAKAQMRGLITSRERAVIDFIIRNTFGYHEEANTLRTSFIAKELGTNAYNISKILKRLQVKNIITKNGSNIAFNPNYNEWQAVKLPHHFQNIATIGNIATNGNKLLSPLATNIATIINSHTQQEQVKTNSIDPLNKTINKTINKTNNIYFNRENFKFENILKEKLEKWRKAFPHLNVEVELKKMEAWLQANPTRRKKNYERFIVNWLLRVNKKGGKVERYIPISRSDVAAEGETKSYGAGNW